MVDPDRSKLSGLVEFDEIFIVFRSKDYPDILRQGRSPVGKLFVAVAVEVAEFVNKNGEKITRPGRVRIEPIPEINRVTSTASSAGTSSRDRLSSPMEIPPTGA